MICKHTDILKFPSDIEPSKQKHPNYSPINRERTFGDKAFFKSRDLMQKEQEWFSNCRDCGSYISKVNVSVIMYLILDWNNSYKRYEALVWSWYPSFNVAIYLDARWKITKNSL